MTGNPIKVVIADDQRVVRDGLATILGALEAIEVVGVAGDGAEAIALTEAHDVDVVLMDLRMPGTDGVAATRALHASRPDVAVVVLTTYADDESILAALQAGALGYLTKDATREQIGQALHAAAAGQSVLDSGVQARLVHAALGNQLPRNQPPRNQLSSNPPGAAPTPLPAGLTDREGEVLALIGQGLSNTEIAQRLYVSTSTVKTHINQIFAKTGSRDRPQAIVYARDHGIAAPTGEPTRP